MKQRSTASAAAGFSLIELLVAMVIALVVTLAITTVMVRSGADRRSTTSVNDVNQTGAYVSYLLDRPIRNAGSGLAQGYTDAYGCAINSRKSDGTVVLPRPAAFGASSPFVKVTQSTLTTRLAPLLIGKGMADTATQVRGDIITVMAGTGGVAELSQDATPNSVLDTGFKLPNNVGYRANDLVLLAHADSTGGCMVEQVSAVSTDTVSLTFGGTYFSTAGTSVQLTAFKAGGAAPIPKVYQIGNANNSLPTMQHYGVGDNNTLYSYDLLQPNGDVAVPIADGVVEMRALYGIDNGATPGVPGTPLTWIDPKAGSSYTYTDLTEADGTAIGRAAAQLKLRRILAVRLGLILRTSIAEKDPVMPDPSTLTLFADLGNTLQQTRSITGTDTNYRYRTIEMTIPMRNAMLAP